MICFGDTSDMTGSALDLGKKGTEESRLVLVFTIGPPLSIQQTKGRAHLEGSRERARWRWLLHICVEVTTEQTRTLSWESGVLSEDEESGEHALVIATKGYMPEEESGETGSGEGGGENGRPEEKSNI